MILTINSVSIATSRWTNMWVAPLLVHAREPVKVLTYYVAILQPHGSDPRELIF
jgi:hypothetical protein